MIQTVAILNHLLTGASITSLEALQSFGCFRLGARIWELKKQGEPIKTEMITMNGKSFARYSWDYDREAIPFG
jgi:hypothetical protein